MERLDVMLQISSDESQVASAAPLAPTWPGRLGPSALGRAEAASSSKQRPRLCPMKPSGHQAAGANCGSEESA